MTPGVALAIAAICLGVWIVGGIWFGTAREAHRKKWGTYADQMKASPSMSWGGLFFLLGMAGFLLFGIIGLVIFLVNL